MSNHTLTILSWDIELVEIINFLKSQKIKNGYVRKASDRISTVTYKNIHKSGGGIAKKISEELKTRALFLTYYEDFGWGFTGYVLGESKGEYQLEYDSQLRIPLNYDIISPFVDNRDGLINLIKCIESNNEELILRSSWQLLVELLGIDISHDFNYDSLRNMPQRYLVLGGIQAITEKKSSLKKALSEHLEPLLLDRGYLANASTTLPCDYAYFKEVNGFYVGLMIYKEGTNSIVAKLKTLFEDIPIFTSRIRVYKNNQDLLKILYELVNEFDKKVIVYSKDMDFNVFNSSEIFVAKMHEFLINKNFNLIEMSIEELAGGKAIYRYRHNSNEISFNHSIVYLGLTCFLTERKNTRAITVKDEWGNIVIPTYNIQGC